MVKRSKRGDYLFLLSSSLDVSFSQPKNSLGKNEFVADTERILISLKTQNLHFQSFVYSFTGDRETGKPEKRFVPFGLSNGVRSQLSS